MRITKRLRASALAAISLLPLLVASPASAAATYAYNEQGRVISITYDDGTQVIYTYDAAGNRTEERRTATSGNRPPVPVADNFTLNEGIATLSFDPRLNDSDPESQALTVFSIADGQFGNASLTGGGTGVLYATTHHRNAVEELVYVLRDSAGATSAGLVTITLANLAPSATNDDASTATNTPVNVAPLGNDTDPGGDALFIQSIGAPSSGFAEISADRQSIAYTPGEGFTGYATIVYTVADGDAGTANGTITINVAAPPNQPPVAVNDTLQAIAGAASNIDPRANDSDPNGHTLSVTAVTQPSHGATSITGGGTGVSYTATSGYSGADSFDYTVSDGYGGTASATVSVNVTATNTPPVANDDTIDIEVVWQGAFTPSGSENVVINDTDANGHALNVTATTNGTYGTVTRNGNVVTWTRNTPITNMLPVPADTFTYTVSDGFGGTDTGTVTVNVTIYPPEP